jgi:hypothetical protein
MALPAQAQPGNANLTFFLPAKQNAPAHPLPMGTLAPGGPSNLSAVADNQRAERVHLALTWHSDATPIVALRGATGTVPKMMGWRRTRETV